MTPSDAISVVMTTSPVPAHPDTSDIAETVASVREQLPTAEIVIAVDGVRPEQEHRRDDYTEYTRRLLWLTNNEWHNVVPILLPEWRHQANATRAALEVVDRPLVLFVEHDTPIVGDIDWPAMCAAVASGAAGCLRLHHEDRVLPDHEWLMLDPATTWLNTTAGALPVRRTSAWWQRPHLCTARFYRERILSRFTPKSRCFVEDVMYGLIQSDCIDHGEAGWFDWRIYLYAPDVNGPRGMQRSFHIDSRKAEPKYDQVFG